MNFLKSESYNLSPDEYLERFKQPHSLVSSNGSSDLDEKDTQILKQILAQSYDDSPESICAKQNVVEELSAVVKRWMDEVAVSTNHEPKDFETYGFGLKVFGSYKLKTNSIDGDIDMICIVPDYFSKEKHFFGMLTNLMRQQEKIRDIFPIPDAIVPLIKLVLNNIQVDLLIARIPTNFLAMNPNFYDGVIDNPNVAIPEKELRNVNGYRTALYFGKYMQKVRNYQVTLKAIKLWAKNKGIYSQIYGYLGGAAYSIMLAKICQLYPHYSPLQLLDRFFIIYSNWVWTLPLSIEKIDNDEREESEMVIYTPLSPKMNAAHYVSRTTSIITKRQLQLASKLVKEITRGSKSWRDLFKPYNYLQQYHNFMEISVMADKPEDFAPWRGNVESKIRKFTRLLQSQPEIAQGIQVNPIPKHFPSKHPHYRLCSKYYIGFRCSPESSLSDELEIDMTQPVRSFLQLLQNYSDIQKIPKQINIGFAHVSKDNLSPQTVEALKNHH